MPYYHAKKSKQRLIGFVVVFALHVILIYGLVSCLTVTDREGKVEDIKLKFVDIVRPKVETMPPIEPAEIKTTIPDYIPPPTFAFEPEVANASNAIKSVQHMDAPPEGSPAIVKAKRSSKGLTHPKYPEESARLGEDGTTELNLNIAPDGNVVDARIVSSSGSERLDKAIADHALRYWKFTPCMQEGRPVACWYPFTFQWNIQNAKKSGTWRSVVAAKND